ncbi:hypothetical protein DL764_009028 [Monosporascus ibericus]|uniref:Uncharacterized protein n=1 Tax=Monosporascus ibericus TaxID=155417 RepID=A0A4Q4SVZ1_9PEZI|nr:hypothetical protein DL764_009028 [Monosporascus ibericus]
MGSESYAHEDSSSIPVEHPNSGYHVSLESETPAFGDAATVPRGSTFLPHTTLYDFCTSPTRSSVASDGYEQSYASTLSEASTSYTSVPEAVSEYGMALGDQSQYAATGPYLPCDFVGWSACNEKFDVDDLHGWVGHVEQYHLFDNFPRKVMCWFCSETFKVGKNASKDERRTNFWSRMQHIQTHIRRDRKGEDDIRVDFHYAEHLHSAGLISEEVYHLARTRRDVIPYPDGSRRLLPLARDIYPSSFVPQGRLLQQERATQMRVNDPREEKRRRRHAQ